MQQVAVGSHHSCLMCCFSGYMAPEYMMRGNYSVKSDVFSFGVIVLEIVTGKKNSDTTQPEDLLTTVYFVAKLYLNIYHICSLAHVA